LATIRNQLASIIAPQIDTLSRPANNPIYDPAQ
jgi:hypothetical protein